jgi:hypothetical protein
LKSIAVLIGWSLSIIVFYYFGSAWFSLFDELRGKIAARQGKPFIPLAQPKLFSWGGFVNIIVGMIALCSISVIVATCTHFATASNVDDEYLKPCSRYCQTLDCSEFDQHDK